jgi:Radical SAM superfamily
MLDTRLDAAQLAVLDHNFEKRGAVYLARDLHPMLDCACAWDGLAGGPVENHPMSSSSTVQLGPTFSGTLRQEFFGAIAFDAGNHRQFSVDLAAHEVLRALNERPRPAADLAVSREIPLATSEISAALDGLVAAGLVAAESGSRLRYLPARDLALNYLQAPTIVEIELTYGCFRTCKHCAYSSSPTASSDAELTANQWALIFQKLADAGVLIVQLTGGDPLFRSDAFDIIEAADRVGLSVYVRSDTAALDEKNIDRLAALDHLWHVGTSIDGADAVTHDFLRGRGAFNLLTRRISALAEAGIPVAAGATLHKGNYETVRAIGSVTRNLGARWFDIGLLSPVGRGAGLADLVLGADEVPRALGTYLAGIAEGDYSPSHQHYLRRVGLPDPFADLAPLMAYLPYVTEWPFSRLRIDPTGSSYTAGKLKGSDYAAGFNLLTTEVTRVWDESPNLKKLRAMGRSGRIHSLDYWVLRSDHDFES